MSCHFGQGACLLLWAPASPVTVLANHSIVSSVKCCGSRLAHDRASNHGIAGSANYEIRPLRYVSDRPRLQHKCAKSH